MTSVLSNFSLGTSGSPGGCKASNVRDAIHCSDVFSKSIDLATPLAPSAHISALFTRYKNQLQKDSLESPNTPTLGTRPTILVDVTSNYLRPQLTVVGQPCHRPNYHIKGPLAELTSSVPGQISNDQSATCLSPSSTDRMGRRAGRYHTGLFVKLILVRKFKRRNQYVESGNNKEGRKGKLRCEMCRKIKSKVFIRL